MGNAGTDGTTVDQAVEALRQTQEELRCAIYAAMGGEDGGREAARLNAAYDGTVEALLAALGPDAPAGAIDLDLASFHSDLFKDEHGFRPRGATYAQAKAYMEAKRCHAIAA